MPKPNQSRNAPRVIKLNLKVLHPAQQTIKAHPARFKVVNCGRRFGKTEVMIDIAVEDLLKGRRVAYVSPTHNNATEVWEQVRDILAPVTFYKNESDRRLKTITGGVLQFWSMEAIERVRGRGYHRVLVDEAALMKDIGIWNEILFPLVTDVQGGAVFGSTPRGRNAFWELYQFGQQAESEWQDYARSVRSGVLRPPPMWWAVTYPSATNPLLMPEEIEIARNTLPEHSFAQEFLAEFMEDSGAVFRRIRDAIYTPTEFSLAPFVAVPFDQRRRYGAGVDWGQKNDFTVIIIIDLDSGQVVAMDRFNKIDWETQRQRLRAMLERWRVQFCFAESNSIGGPNIEALQKEGLRIRPFDTTATSKPEIIRLLSLAFEQSEIGIPDYAPLINELLAYEAERMPSGNWRYNAPHGVHDDCVMALAIAWWAKVKYGRRMLVA